MTESPPKNVPLCVDLDGTLIRTDMFWESLIALVKRRPACMFWLPFWLLHGRAHLKDQLARRIQIDVEYLPYNEDVLDYLRKERQSGRKLVMATASHVDVARRIAKHVDLFNGDVLGTTATLNLKGAAKLKALQDRYGSRGFDYIGDAKADLPVWKHANQALVVTDSPSLISKVREVALVGRVFDRRRNRLRIIYKTLRVHQWAKNVLILLPLIASHQITNVSLALAAVVAFVSFSLCASAIYILNDSVDLEADRRHPKKKHRPMACGELSVGAGLMLSLGCLIVSFALASLLPPTFLLVLGGYLALTTGYSLYLKQFVLADVIVLAQLYTMRVYAGGAATGIVPSHWLLTFSLFVFLSLALMKRFTEIRLMTQSDRKDVIGRGYRTSDAEHIASVGSSSGLIAVLVLALYISSKEVLSLYSHPELLWLVCPVMLYWISRAWMLSYRDRMDDDPVVFAVRDGKSYLVALLIGIILAVAK